MSKFFAQYNHPQWQKKRLERLEASGFECECCGDSESQLHVHHKGYIKGRKPWEYSDDQLEVLCGDCHAKTHAEIDAFRLLLSRTSGANLNQVAGYCAALLLMESENPEDAVDLNSFEFSIGFLDAIGGLKKVQTGLDGFLNLGRVTVANLSSWGVSPL
jgi:hypothetical protein